MGCLVQKKEENEEEKKENNFNDIIEDILDIKAVQVKGNMLFSETEGSFKDHYEFKEKLQSNNSLTILTKVVNKFSGCVRLMKTIKKALIDAQEDEKNFMKEIAILRTLDHMNILKIPKNYIFNQKLIIILVIDLNKLKLYNLMYMNFTKMKNVII